MENESVVSIVLKYFKSRGFWKKTYQEQEEVLIQCMKELNSLCEVDFKLVCDFTNVERYQETGGGIAHGKKMVLFKPSLMTFLHEYRHLLVKNGICESVDEDKECDSRKWSHTIFKLALPKLYEKNVKEGKFKHIM